MKLIDYKNSLVQEAAASFTSHCTTIEDKMKNLFLYVRDNIRFGFPPKGDLTKASETIKLGIGQCNTKAILLAALYKAIKIPARIHFSLIKKEIQQGIFPAFIYKLLPPEISHSWVEIHYNSEWVRIDSFINDKEFYEGARSLLKENGMDTGYSVACSKNRSSIEFSLEEEQFVQMDAVTEDQGIFEEPMKYFKSPLYKNRPGLFKILLYKLIRPEVNRGVEKIRRMKKCTDGLCALPSSGLQLS